MSEQSNKEDTDISWFKVSRNTVGGEYTIERTVLICLVKHFQTVAEQTKGGANENAAGLQALQLGANFQHRLAGGNHIVYDNNVLALYGVAQVLVLHNGVATIDHAGVIPALIEHAQIYTQLGCKINAAVQGASSGEMTIR